MVRYNRLNEIMKQQSDNLLAMMSNGYSENVSQAINVQRAAINAGKKVIIAGNGGSAADAQHFACELVGRFLKEREGIPAIALTTDTSILTSIGNDYGFDSVFSRQINAIGNKGDVFIGISTSGNSKNIINAFKECKKKGIITIALVGKDGGLMKSLADYVVLVPINETPRVQEIHTMTIHMMCEMIEGE